MAENEQSRPQPESGSPTTFTEQKFSRSRRRVARTAGTPYGTAALNAALEDMAEAPERHPALYQISAAMGNLLASGELYEETYVKSVLLDAAIGRGKSYREAERTIRDGISTGRTTPRTPGVRRTNYTRNDATVATIMWWESVGQTVWTGRSSGNDLRVLFAFGILSLQQGKVRFSASYRQLAEEAGVSVPTVQAALKRGLKGFVRRVEKGNRLQGTSSVWQLITKQAKVIHGLGQTQATLMCKESRAPIGRPDHDYWNRWPNGWRLYSLLSKDEGLTARDISEGIGCRVETARRNLNRLRDKHLAKRDPDGLWTALSPPSDVRDGGFRRRAREDTHQKQRELWGKWRSVLIKKRAAR